MRKVLFFFTFFIIYASISIGQGNMLSISSVLPPEITICGSEQKVEISIVNPSPFGLSNVVLQITMPVGLVYQAGTITGATELNITNLSQPQFSLTNIPSQGARNISFFIAANCDLMDYIAQGQIVSMVARVNYLTSNNISTYDQHTNYLYHVKQPNLSIISITNQTYSGNIGDVFTRCITITNGGLGALSNFTFTHTHGNGIQVNNVSIGVWNSAGGVETVTMNGSNFLGIGNNNALFENAELITICETIEVINCVSVGSSYEVKWGCNGQICQNSISTANVVFPNLTPNLVITPTAGVNTCLGLGNANTPSLRIINNGMGDAYNVFLDIFHATSTINYDAGIRSNIDPASFTVQVGINGTPVSITPVQTFAASAQYCLSANPKGRVYINIPLINAHDTVYLKWRYYNCCSDAPGGTRILSGWRYQGTYKSICNNNYVISNSWGYVYRDLYGTLVNELSPSNITSGETKNFSFLFSSYGNSYPSTTGRHWKFVVNLPPCLSYESGSFQIQRYTGTQYWYPSTVTVSGNTLTAIFDNNPPWDLYQSIVKFNLIANCANPGCVEGGNNLTITSFYIPDGSCLCEVLVSRLTITVGVICPVICEGLNNKAFDTYRSSYGAPDNDNNGLADPLPATLNFNLIRRDRAMFGDTITTLSQGLIKTSVAHPAWNYCYRVDSVLNGNQLSFVDGLLEIHQYSTGNVYTCNVNTSSITTAGSTRKFNFDISPVTLAALGLLPAGFTYNDNDSIAFRVRYRVSSNPGGTILDCFVKNKMFVSDVPNPASFAHKFGCNVFEGRFSIIGYYYTNWGPDNFNVNTCNQVTISQNYYLSIGPCCQNYAGGNLFPFEYRNWAHAYRFRVILPHGYQFISARFNQVRTAGTNGGSTSAWVNLIPVNLNSDTLVFMVKPFYETFGGAIPLSDDGFYGTLQVTLAPTCNVVSNVASNVGYYWDFGPSGYLAGSSTPNSSNVTTHDVITYQGPDIFVQSILPTVLAYDDEVNWEISLSNTTNINALNTWFSGDESTGVTILEVWDLDNNVVVLPVGDIYQIGVLSANAVRHFRIKATYTSCFPSTMMLYAGWNCNAGYPATVASYPCTPDQLQLSLEPQVPNLIANITNPLSTVDLCDTTGYVVEGINVQLGTAYNLKLKVVLPAGVSIIPGSCKLSYPTASPYVAIPDPTWISGTQWQWDISALNALIGADGLPGILDTTLNSVKISFRVITNCFYTSGSVIGFNFHGQSHCGNYTGQEISMSSQLAITGATEPYLTDIHVNTSYVSPCAINSTRLKIRMKNNGPLATGATDSISLTFPEGIFYIPNSFLAVHNAPVNPLPVTEMPNNQQIVTWKIPPNVQVGDSVVFEINYFCQANVVECGIYYIDAMSYSSRNLLCQLSGQNCDILVSTGNAQIPIYIYKSYLSLSNASAWSVPSGANQETVYTSYTISNNGESIIANNTVFMSYFNDVDGNQILSAPDVFLGADSINVYIDTNSVNPFNSHITVPVGSSCKLIFALDTNANGCICELDQIFANVQLVNAGQDTVVCAGQSAYIGLPPTNGYTYQWQPVTGLNNATLSRPLFTGTNTGTTPITLPYILSTNRIACTTNDTVNITVRPVPVVDADSNKNIGSCPTAANAILNGTAAGEAPFIYSWTAPAGLSNPNISNPVADPSVTTTYTLTVTDVFGCSASDDVQVMVHPLPTAEAGNNQIIGACAAALNANLVCIASGTPPLVYSWMPTAGLSNPNDAITIADPASTTVYTVTVIDTFNCSVSDSVTVTVDPLPTVNAGPDQHVGQCVSAANATINALATGVGPFSFAWSPSAGLSNPNIANPVADPSATTTYTVTVTDIHGCTATDDILVAIDPLPSADAGSDQNLGACPGAANANMNGTGTGTGPLTYSWLPTTGLSNANIANPIADPASTATYTLTVTDIYGCTATDAILITVDPLPTANAGADQNLGACPGAANANMNGTGTGTGPLTYSWLPAAGLSNPNIANPVADPASTTTYTLTVTDTYGCTATDAVLITVDPLPTANAGADQNLGACPGAANANLTGTGTGISPLSYSWLPAAGLSNPSIANPVADPASTTTYTLTVTDKYGCTATDAVLITVDPLPTASAGADQNLGACPGAANANMNGTGTGTGPLTYSWLPATGLSSTNIANPVADPASTTTYTLTVTDKYGCTATDAVLITVDPLPTASAGADQNLGACPGAANANLTGTGTGTGPLTYSWLPVADLGNPNIANPVADPASTTTYTLTVTDTYGCTATDAVLITVDPLPTANAGADQNLGACPGAANANLTGTGTGTGPLTYSWLPAAGLSNPSIANPVADPASTTTYTLTVTDTYGCTATDAVLITVDPLPTANAGADQNLGACPNAANANLSGTGTGISPLTYSWLPLAGLSNPNIANPVADPVSTTVYTLTVTDKYGCAVTDQVQIIVDPLPTVDAGSAQNLGACPNAANADLNAVPTGTMPYVYSWMPATGLSNPSVNNPVADPASTTTYTVTLTDTYGCTATDAVLITVDPLPTANAGTDHQIGSCSNAANASLNGSGTGTGPLVYSWSPVTGLDNPGIANPIADPSSTTTYTLSVTDIYNCVSTDAALVTVNPLPTVNAGNDQHVGACANAANANINAVITGTGPLGISWLPTDGLTNPNIANPIADPSVTTTYTITVTDTYGCTVSDDITIYVDPLPTVDAGVDQQIGTCPNAANATLNAMATGISPLVYVWAPTNGLSDPNNASPIADPAATTLYSITVTDVYGCSVTDDILVTVNPLPTVDAGSDQHIGACPGAANAYINTQATGTNPINYQWTPANGLSAANILNPFADPSSTTTYSVTATDTYGCTATDAVVIFVDAVPTANAGTNQVIGTCAWAANADLVGSGSGTLPVAYSWSPASGLNNPGVANTVADPSVTTTYTLTVTDAYGCVATDDVTVTVAGLPAVSVSADNPVVCATFASHLTASGAITYAWSPGIGLSSVTSSNVTAVPPATTIYTVTGTDIYSCTAAAQITITVNPNPVVTITPAVTTLCVGSSDTLTANGAATYLWNPGTGLSATSGNVVIANPVVSTIYTLTGNTLGCAGSTTITVTVNPLPLVTLNPINDVCLHDVPFVLTQGTPAGGVYTGPGITGTDIFDPALAGTGIHILTYTYTDNNLCVNEDTQTIKVKPNPVMTVTPNMSYICRGTSVSLVATGANNYAWSPAATLSASTGSVVVATPLTPSTIYTVTGEINGCTASVEATVQTYTTIPVSVTPEVESICPGGSVTMTASGALHYVWQPPIGLSSNIVPTVVSTPDVTTTYTVLGTDADGCTGSATGTVIIYPESIIEFSAMPHEGCTPMNVDFEYLPDSMLDMNTLHWDFGDMDTAADVSNQPSCSYIYTSQGNYIVVLTATSVHGCHAEGRDTIIVYQTPEAGFYPHPDIARLDEPEIFFYDQSNNAQHWYWDFGDPASIDSNYSFDHNTSHHYSDTGTYLVMHVVTNIYDCADTVYQTVKIINPFYFWVPGAFTPNGDATNNVFMGQGVGFREEDFSMVIYDRWGELVFKTNDPYQPWDGIKAGANIKCPAGVYVWMIDITEENTVHHKMKGTVTLIR